MRLLAHLLAAAVAASPASAQRLGVELGAIHSDVDWAMSPSPGTTVVGSRSSATGGLTVRIQANGGAAVGTGLAIVPRGGDYFGIEYRATYVELPVVAILQTGMDQALFVEFGGSFGLRVSCDRSFQTSAGWHSNDCESETVPEAPPHPDVELSRIRTMNLSWRLGFGGRIRFGPGLLVASARVLRGGIDIHPDESQRMVPHAAGLMLGYEWSR